MPGPPEFLLKHVYNQVFLSACYLFPPLPIICITACDLCIFKGTTYAKSTSEHHHGTTHRNWGEGHWGHMPPQHFCDTPTVSSTQKPPNIVQWSLVPTHVRLPPYPFLVAPPNSVAINVTCLAGPPCVFNWNYAFCQNSAPQKKRYNLFSLRHCCHTNNTKCLFYCTCDLQTLVPGCVWNKQMNSDWTRSLN